MDIKQFKKKLSVLEKTGQSLQDMVHEMGIFAIHCVNIGKTAGGDSPIQLLWNSLNKLKGINRQAWLNWVAEFGCVRFVKQEDGTFLAKYQDKSKTNPEFNAETAVQMATDIPFWEFAKDPVPNTKPFDYLDALRNVLANGKLAATGGAKGDKPKRQIEHGEIMDVISYILNNTESAMEKLGFNTPTKDKEVTAEIAQLMAELMPDRQELKAA